MFAVRRIIRNNKQLSNYICTSSVLHCDPDKNVTNLFRRQRKSKKYEERKEKTAKSNLGDFTPPLSPPKREIDMKRGMSKAMVSSVEKVASELGGDEEQIKKDLLEYVKMLDAEKDSEVVPEKQESKTQPRRMRHQDWLEATQTPKEAFDLDGFHGRKKVVRLGIFKEDIMNKENQVKLKIWDSLKEEELAAKSKRSPENYFEELINWTNQGRLWKFPIDNDEGREEAETSFTEHVFLEKHLEPWCPKKGPIKKFMDMVLIGLGKNPYLTAKEKRAHIMWFKFYFEAKKKLLQELGAMGPTKLEGSSQESTS